MLVHVASAKVDLFALTNMHIFSRASMRLVLAGARSARCKSTLLAALVERSPMLTPDEAPLTVVQQQAQAAAVRQKVYPTTLTAAEEGPDQQRARLRMEALVEREGGREGDGDRTGDQRSLDRQLAHRLYLLVQVDGRWQFPHLAWQPPESARDGLRRAITQSCGDGLATHQMGNAPLGLVATPVRSGRGDGTSGQRLRVGHQGRARQTREQGAGRPERHRVWALLLEPPSVLTVCRGPAPALGETGPEPLGRRGETPQDVG